MQTESLGPGEVGYVVANVRTVKETRAGDTVFDATKPDVEPLPGYKDVHSMVFAGHLSDGHARSTRRCATRSRSCSSTTRR